jgi:hypothetical protein
MTRATAFGFVFVLLTSTQSVAQTVRAGFNDATGINSDGLSNNSPYNVANAALGGQGAGESGWAGPWATSLAVPVVGGVSFEGDGAAFFQGSSGAGRTLQQPMTGITSIQLRMMIPLSSVSGNGVGIYITQSNNTNTFLRIGPQWQAAANGHFNVIDGIENGAVTGEAAVEDTGFLWTAGTWHNVRIEINTVTRTWDFFVDEQHYNAPDPLGYRGNPAYLDDFGYFNEINGPNGSYLDAVVIQPVPEPGLIIGVAATFAASPILLRRLRRSWSTATTLTARSS